MPDFLVDEIKEYIDSIYEVNDTDRLVPVDKSYIRNTMIRVRHKNKIMLLGKDEERTRNGQGTDKERTRNGHLGTDKERTFMLIK